MDFGVVAGFDSIVCPNSSPSDTSALENGSKHKNWCGSGFLKQERPISIVDDDYREFKLAKTTVTATTPTSTTTTTTSPSSCCGVTEGHRHQQQMLSFSSPNSQPAVTFPYYNNHQSSSFSRSTTTGYGSTAAVNMNMIMNGLSGFRGPFTPSQWMELEHQALIYKYITANVPIPSNLLNPIRKAFESVAATGFSAFPGLRSNALGWGAAFHLGFSSSDPEPGRCRRTDGKKWRCSRDAVADQKYCERHMNRGRHRSRKPVEGQPAGTTTTTTKSTTTTTSTTPMAGSSSNSARDQHSALQPSVNRSVPNKENNADRAAESYHHTTMLSMMSSSSKGNAYEDSSSRPEFGLVCSDSLLNPLNCRGFGIIPSDHDNTSKPSPQNSLRQFIDAQPDRTHLSISMSSSATSPANEKLTASPLMLSHELEMGLSVGTAAPSHQRQATTNWVPISWESSMGGPLGEALHNPITTTAAAAAKPLNLIDPWDNSSRIAASSPTGVLQRGAFGSLSNSSAGSSPRAESSRTTHDGAGSICNGLINPGLMNPYLPAI